MDLLKSFKLVPNGEGYDLIIYFDAGSVDAEFAEELSNIKEGPTGLKRSLIESIKEKFPDKNIKTVKLMLGSVLLSSFLLGLPVAANAAAAGSVSTAQTQVAYNYNVKLLINGKLQSFSKKPMIFNNLTYVPVCEFGKAIGASVWWNASSRTVGINHGSTSIAFVRGSAVARVNGIQKAMPASLSIDGTTYAPVKFIAENLGYEVTYNSASKTVNVSKATVGTTYTVLSGDSLWKLSQKFGISVAALKSANNLTSDNIYPGQTLTIPKAGATTPPQAASPAADNVKWPAVTYIVQPGDTATSIAKKFGRSVQDIMKFNYMAPEDWFDAGEKIAISGYAPRVYTVKPGSASAPAQRGAPVDWFLEGQYLVKRNSTFTVVDVDTGKQFRARMIGGYNHLDIEPLTSADTNVMKSLFGTWEWSPRAIVIYIDGMNLAASMSGMPHDADVIGDNGVTVHFDVYMKNSSSHSATTSQSYMQQHAAMVQRASGK